MSNSLKRLGKEILSELVINYLPPIFYDPAVQNSDFQNQRLKREEGHRPYTWSSVNFAVGQTLARVHSTW